MNTRLLPIAVIVGTIGLTSALPSAAQNTTSDMNRTTTTQDRGFDWGWLGLLGLAGLAGLRRRPDTTSYSTPRPAR